MASSGTSSPCGACKFLRRKCASDCIFAPYFTSEQGAARFAAIHKVFGASNVSKLLLHIPVADRCEAVVTIAYEAQARLRDPVYGCVSHIFALQQQVPVACLQTQLMQVKAQLAQGPVDPTNLEDHWPANIAAFPTNYPTNYISPQNSIETVDHKNDAMCVQEIQSGDDDQLCFQPYSKKRHYVQDDLGELQELAIRMMRN
ncbi:hypothetical protein LguiA_020488 [Lonicera macranthoides]